MRYLILAAAAGAVALPATGASAQYWGGGGDRARHEQRECQRELRHANNRWQYERELRECRREIARARRDEYRRYDRDDRYDRGYGDYYGRRGY
jgi:hypothetical protein